MSFSVPIFIELSFTSRGLGWPILTWAANTDAQVNIDQHNPQLVNDSSLKIGTLKLIVLLYLML